MGYECFIETIEKLKCLLYSLRCSYQAGVTQTLLLPMLQRQHSVETDEKENADCHSNIGSDISRLKESNVDSASFSSYFQSHSILFARTRNQVVFSKMHLSTV